MYHNLNKLTNRKINQMKKAFLLSAILFLYILSGFACTTAVVSGKYTKNGRPLLWKNRDTYSLKNKIEVFEDGKYSYTGLVNSKDTLGKSIWIGFNEKGFAIMNSASYNLNTNDTIKQSGGEGRLMKRALQTCASIDDFEKLLNNLDKPTRLEANFGVIDANGGAAYFEVGNYIVQKFDANDPGIAPYGYIVRSNYSFSGKMGIGGGYIRYETAVNVFDDAIELNDMSAKTIIQKASRNLTHSLTGTDLNSYSNIKSGTTTYVCFEDLIPRNITSSAVVVEGVKAGEDPAYTTMWAAVGWPLASVTVPVWLSKKCELPGLLRYDNKLKDSRMCALALETKKRCFPYKWGTSSKHYMDVNALLNADNTGVLQIIQPFEDSIFEQAESMLNKWRSTKINYSEMKEFYDRIDSKISEFYKDKIGIRL